MTGKEKLYRAISEIDGRFIDEAALPYRIAKPKFIKPLALAASLALTVTVVLIAGRNGIFDMGGNMMGGDMSGMQESTNDGYGGNTGSASAPESDADCNESESAFVLYSKSGSLTLTESEAKRFAFSLSIYSEHAPIHAEITLLDAGGNECLSTTDPNKQVENKLTAPIIYVNGELAEAIPTAPGSYTVEIDITHLTEEGYTVKDSIVFTEFGKFEIFTPY